MWGSDQGGGNYQDETSVSWFFSRDECAFGYIETNSLECDVCEHENAFSNVLHPIGSIIIYCSGLRLWVTLRIQMSYDCYECNNKLKGTYVCGVTCVVYVSVQSIKWDWGKESMDKFIG